MTSEFVEGRCFVELAEWDAEYFSQKFLAAYALNDDELWLRRALDLIDRICHDPIFKRRERLLEQQRQAQLC